MFPKRTYFGKAIAQKWLDDDENAIQSLNIVGNVIARMSDLFEANDIKERDVDKFLKSGFIDQLNANVKDISRIQDQKMRKSKNSYPYQGSVIVANCER